MPGPRGQHSNQDTFDGQRPALPPPPPKQINPNDPKPGPRSPRHQNPDSYSE